MKRFVLVFILFFIPFNFLQAQSVTDFVNTGINQAQSVTDFIDSGLNIEFEANQFTPFTEITAHVNDYSLTTQTSDIYWEIDGVTKKELTNQRTITFVTKDLNQPTTLKVTVESIDGEIFTAQEVVNPSYLDIIIEPQTRTPAFYRGRGLPTLDSTINLTAVLNGDNKNVNNYIYNWTINGTNIESGASRGKYKTSTVVPYGEYNVITVTISDLQGKPVAIRSTEIRSADPEIKFYRVNPLNGIESIPIKGSLTMIGNSVNVRAEPYNLDIKTYNRPELLEWRIDGTRSPSSRGNPYEVTLAKQGFNGTSLIGFHVRNLEDVLQGAESEFEVKY